MHDINRREYCEPELDKPFILGQVFVSKLLELNKSKCDELFDLASKIYIKDFISGDSYRTKLEKFKKNRKENLNANDQLMQVFGYYLILTSEKNLYEETDFGNEESVLELAAGHLGKIINMKTHELEEWIQNAFLKTQASYSQVLKGLLGPKSILNKELVIPPTSFFEKSIPEHIDNLRILPYEISTNIYAKTGALGTNSPLMATLFLERLEAFPRPESFSIFLALRRLKDYTASAVRLNTEVFAPEILEKIKQTRVAKIVKVKDKENEGKTKPIIIAKKLSDYDSDVLNKKNFLKLFLSASDPAVESRGDISHPNTDYSISTLKSLQLLLTNKNFNNLLVLGDKEEISEEDKIIKVVKSVLFWIEKNLPDQYISLFIKKMFEKIIHDYVSYKFDVIVNKKTTYGEAATIIQIRNSEILNTITTSKFVVYSNVQVYLKELPDGTEQLTLTIYDKYSTPMSCFTVTKSTDGDIIEEDSHVLEKVEILKKFLNSCMESGNGWEKIFIKEATETDKEIFLEQVIREILSRKNMFVWLGEDEKENITSITRYGIPLKEIENLKIDESDEILDEEKKVSTKPIIPEIELSKNAREFSERAVFKTHILKLNKDYIHTSLQGKLSDSKHSIDPANKFTYSALGIQYQNLSIEKYGHRYAVSQLLLGNEYSIEDIENEKEILKKTEVEKINIEILQYRLKKLMSEVKIIKIISVVTIPTVISNIVQLFNSISEENLAKVFNTPSGKELKKQLHLKIQDIAYKFCTKIKREFADYDRDKTNFAKNNLFALECIFKHAKNAGIELDEKELKETVAFVYEFNRRELHVLKTSDVIKENNKLFLYTEETKQAWIKQYDLIIHFKALKNKKPNDIIKLFADKNLVDKLIEAMGEEGVLYYLEQLESLDLLYAEGPVRNYWIERLSSSLDETSNLKETKKLLHILNFLGFSNFTFNYGSENFDERKKDFIKEVITKNPLIKLRIIDDINRRTLNRNKHNIRPIKR